MSTRCQIGFYAEKTDSIDKPFSLIYRHCDGYPDSTGVLPSLEPFLRYFLRARGWDIEYVAARALCYLIHEHTKDLPGQVNESPRRDEDPKFGGVLSYGICAPDGLHGDIQYYYAVYEDRIEVREPRRTKDFDITPVHTWPLIGGVDLMKEPETFAVPMN